MNFKQYSRYNNILGWLVFAISAFTYLSTMERTVSLWDCGEFIPSAFKLEVSHPPGAPFHALLNRFFCIFAGDNRAMVPIMVNGCSAICSAFAILFLFWSITALAVKMLFKDENNIERGPLYAVLGAGLVGALCYNFSDSFWFSAVEGEVYAMSSFFTALIFWLVLKWERRSEEHNHLRWMILIFYMTGIVIGVHLLGLLVIPVVVLLYYYKKYNVTRKGTIIALVAGFVALGIVQVGVIQLLPKIASWFDLMFVNSFGLPFWSGVLFFIALLAGGIIWGIIYTHKKKLIMWNLGILCVMSVILGYSSYAITVIRSYANPPIDMNDPDNIYSMISYVTREQYGDNYFTYGPYWYAYSYGELDEGAMQYYKGKDAYEELGPKEGRTFKSELSTIFPRMYSPQDNHIQGYRYWTGIKNSVDEKGQPIWEDDLQANPNFRYSFVKHNLRFFLQYQMNYMYFRFFAWNFIGRQNDMQGTQNEFHQGNWQTGIPFIDEAIGNGPQKNVAKMYSSNKARNSLFALPFILGILGMIAQYRRKRRDFVITFFFFFMTGIAIALYLNMPCPQPRERDYAFVGSFYVFAIFVGLGVIFLYDWFSKRMAASMSAIVSSVICLALVPGIMAAQEWDDHDRSGRTISLDYGVDYLESCAPHAVMFCNGDNDTYPLWYAQEVAGIRDDIRIINLSLLSTDWYLNEMRKPVNHAPGLALSISPAGYLGWEQSYYAPQYATFFPQDRYIDIQDVLKYLGDADPSKKLEANPGMRFRMPKMPAKKIRMKIDKEKVLKNGTVLPQYADMIPEYMEFELSKNGFLKSDIVVLDFLATNNWDVPIYFSITSGPGDYLNLGAYLQQEGLAYRIVPFKKVGPDNRSQDTRTESSIMYNNVMKKFKFGGIDKGNPLVDYVTNRQCNNMRGLFTRLGEYLLNEGQKEKCIEVVDKCLKEIPESAVPYDYFCEPLAELYVHAGATEKGRKLGLHMADILSGELDYYSRASSKMQPSVGGEIQRALSGLRRLQRLAEQYKMDDLMAKVKPSVEMYQAKFGQDTGGGE
ncbi:MAG: DUF2723 domain-containing protein [Bacteroidetes bacterium]|nr:DUF2723 domain-containing protein [Bacteroidota bacterium]